jgi:hypothetical protein
MLLGAPLGALGMGMWDNLLDAQSAAAYGPDPGVLDFWVRRMGVPASLIPGGEKVASGDASRDINAANAGYGREPIFYYLDEKENTLIPAKELDTKRLQPTGDLKIDWSLQKLRLNTEDNQQFSHYASGGFYLDFQQHEATTSMLSSLASSAFSGFFPDGTFHNPFTKSSIKPGTAKSGNISGGASRSSSSAAAAKSSGGAAGVQLATPGTDHSIALPGGVGKAAFACFAKDRKRSAFGMFLNAIVQATNSSLTSLVPLLSMPVISAPALQTIRALAGALQSHGPGQHWILQSGPMDISATADGVKSLGGALRVTNGTYVVIPKQHGAELTTLKDWKLMDGFLVPKDADEREVFHDTTSIMQGLTYMTITAKVSKAKMGNCLLSLPG